MTLDEACDQFERFFGSVGVEPGRPMSTIVCTGALGLPDKPAPVLTATAELAIVLWQRTALDYAEEFAKDASLKGHRLIWVEEPRVLSFKMTMQDASGAQRVASNRFAVYSVLAISELEPSVEAPKPVPARRARRTRQAKRGEASGN
jgi:hypothetical protein